MDVRLPDGTIIRNVPDGISKAELTAKLKANGINVGEEKTASSTAKNIAGGLVRGAGSIGATLAAPFDVASDALAGRPLLSSNKARRDSMDAFMRDRGVDTDALSYAIPKVGAEIAGTLPVGGLLAQGAARLGATAPLVSAIQSGGLTAQGAGIGTRMLGGAISGAGTAAVVDPSEALSGAAVGAALPGATRLAGAAGEALGRQFRASPQMTAVAQKAEQYGIPVTFGDVADGRLTRAVRSILKDAPVSGGMAATAQEAKQEAFNKAVGGTFGAPEVKLTEQVMDSARKRLGAEFDRIWGSNQLTVDAPLVQSLQSLGEAADKLPKQAGQSLKAEIQDLMSRMKTDASGNVVVDGDTANKFQQYLRRRAESSSELRNELGDLRQSIIGAFNRSVSPQDAQALTQVRGEYKSFKTVEPLLRKSEVGVAGRLPGDVPAALLPSAVAQSYSRPSGNALADLAQVGSQFLVDRVPQTGGSARAAVQNTAIGAALMGTGGLPFLAAGVPAAYGLQRAMQSEALGRMATSPPSNRLSVLLNQSALPVIYRAAPVVAAQ